MFEDRKVGLAVTYLEYKQESVHSLSNVVASLWRQILPKNASLPSMAYETYNRHGRQGTRPGARDMLELLRSQAEALERVFIVVDGLDECRTDGDSLGRLIEALRDVLPHANMMFTSRSLDAADFGLGEVVPVCLEHAPDVAHFVEVTVQRSAEQHAYTTRFSTSDMSTIVTESAGTRQVEPSDFGGKKLIARHPCSAIYWQNTSLLSSTPEKRQRALKEH
jgi:hypothetical protein